MSDFRKLKVWAKAHALAIDTHRVAHGIRSSHYTSLRSQLIRAALSVPSNIVEGSGQRSARDFGRFLGYALNSATELEYHLLVAGDIGVIRQADSTGLTRQVVEVRKMLHGPISRLDRATDRNERPERQA